VAPAFIQLVGTHGSTERFALGDRDSELFTRGSSHSFDIPVPKVGGLWVLYVRQLRRACVCALRGAAAAQQAMCVVHLPPSYPVHVAPVLVRACAFGVRGAAASPQTRLVMLMGS